jgi:gliding motility-associated-like protein
MVNPLPTLTLTGSHSVACISETISISATGANTFTWTNTGATTNSVSMTLSATTVFTVNGTDANGCVGVANYTQLTISCDGTVAVSTISTNVSCRTKNDAKIHIEPFVHFRNYMDTSSTSTFSNYVVDYNWQPAELCHDKSCTALNDLKAGSYSLTMIVTSTVTPSYIRQDTIRKVFDVLDENPPCDLTIYSGVTPNGDGINDVWRVDNLELYTKNKVTIYNRWGMKVYEAEGYNNTNKSWPNRNELDFLSSTTYFYIIDLGDGSKPVKGWIELMKD